MEKIKELIKNIWHTQIVNSIIIIIVSIFLYSIISKILNRSESKAKSKLFTSNKGKTYINLLKSIIRYIFIIITFLILLQINGVNVGSVLAGVGVLGVVFGLAIQDWLKDIIRGSSILSDDYFKVGDIVRYKNIEGKVLVIGLKTTKIKDLATSNIISIANRNIEEIEVVSSFIYVRIPMPYEVKLYKAESVIQDIVELVKKNNNVKNCTYKGITELASSSIEYLIEVDCDENYKLHVKRDALRTVLLVYENNNIVVPYTQIDIHNK